MARRGWCRKYALTGLLLLSPLAGVHVLAPSTTVPPLEINRGTVTIVDPSNLRRELTHGDRHTQFVFQLPDGASCPGDSFHDQYRFESFIIPVTDDPAAVTYGVIGPEPDTPGRYSMFLTDTSSYLHQLLPQNPFPDMRATIPPLQVMDFDVLAGAPMPGGDYRMGIACTYFTTTTTYWDVDVVITNTADGDLTWRLSDESPDVFQRDSSSGAWQGVAVAIAVVAIAGGAVLYLRRSSASATTRRPKKVTS